MEVMTRQHIGRALATILLIGVFGTFVLPPLPARAAIPPARDVISVVNKPFGGRIEKIQACIDPPGLRLTIGPPVGGEYLLTPASRLFLFGVIIPRVWTLGLAGPATINCRGNPAAISGAALAGGMASQAISSGILGIQPIPIGVFAEGVSGVEVTTPLGSFVATGQFADFFGSLAGPGLETLATAGTALSGVLSAFSGVVSAVSGDPVGAVLSAASVASIFAFGIPIPFGFFSSLFGLRRPPHLGPAHPIMMIGTSARP